MALEKHFKKKLTSGLVSVAIMMLSLPGHPASAASCSGQGCDGTDPASTGCATPPPDKPNAVRDVDHLTGDQMGGLNATLYLRWSDTCQTNWARVNLADNVYYDLKVVRQSDGATQQSSYDLGGSYTYQLHTGSIKAQACLRYRWVWWPQYSQWYCTKWV